MRILSIIILASVLFNANVRVSAAEDGAGSASFELDLVSKYVWRGIPLSVSEAYQPSGTFSKYGFTGNIWLNYSVDNPRANRLSEVDYTLSYERELLGVSVSPGFALYTYSDADTCGEGYLKLSYPVAFLKVLTSHYLSMVNGDAAGGYYGDAGLGYEKQFANDSVLTGSALLGWGNAKFNAFNYGQAGLGGRLNVLTLDAAISFTPFSGASVRPHLTYYSNLPEALRGPIRTSGGAPASLVAGVAAGYEF
ncbi:MAG: hypothetical protein NDI60_03465 [Elusimicrobiales bacterium]|nr:hypothetical protein [Elusimicrobiales bacterium]